jgi:hypothetical protein
MANRSLYEFYFMFSSKHQAVGTEGKRESEGFYIIGSSHTIHGHKYYYYYVTKVVSYSSKVLKYIVIIKSLFL